MKLDEPIVRNVLKDDHTYLRLGSGEREGIAWSLDTGSLFATDDYKARKIAKKHGVKCIGTLGLVREAYKRNYFSDKVNYLQTVDLLAEDLHLTPELIEWARKI